MEPDAVPSTASVIRSGEYLIVQKPDGEQSRVVRFTPKQKILIEKLKFSADSVFGKPYGLFEVSNNQCTPMSVDRLIEELHQQEAPVATSLGDSETTTSEVTDSIDPRLVIAPSALKLEPEQKRQKLEMDAVLEMKKQGISGQELVAKLVQGSASFQTRTVFSQSKYIKRKAKKHNDRVLILRPTIRLLAKAYYLKDPDRLAMLRADQLALMLQMAGVHHGKNIIVFEQTLGLITSAVMERLGGKGACVHIHRGAVAQSIPCVHSMNYSESTLSTFLPVRIKCLLAGSQLPYDTNRRPVNEEDGEDNENDEADKKNIDKLEDQDQEALSRRNDRLDREKQGLDIISEERAHSLIIGSRTVDPISILELMFPKLAPSSSIVIYSPHQNVLISAYEWLSKRPAINLMLSDQMCRVMQVLPDRTHPLMAQYVAGGHVLTGIKVIDQ
uniref:tRNA (adenine(58)-N(1))-methyltransferase non-catalytic subunit TRM6 n=1 Tax=Caenorhabditis tropicalis TaxID=1561998 RepID=A0A1I7T4H2_9PELO